jgi:acyl-CoA dehydrogenase
MLIAAEALGIGRVALEKAVKYGNERGRVQPADRDEPRACSSRSRTRWPDSTPPNWCCARRHGSTTTASRAVARRTPPNISAPTPVSVPPDRALQLHGGMGYSEEYHVSRYFREARLMKIAPVSQEMILNFLGEHVLGMPRSY